MTVIVRNRREQGAFLAATPGESRCLTSNCMSSPSCWHAPRCLHSPTWHRQPSDRANKPGNRRSRKRGRDARSKWTSFRRMPTASGTPGVPRACRCSGTVFDRPPEVGIRGAGADRLPRAMRIPYDNLVDVASEATGSPAIPLCSTRIAPTERPDIGYALVVPSMTIVKVIAMQVVGLMAATGGDRARVIGMRRGPAVILPVTRDSFDLDQLSVILMGQIDEGKRMADVSGGFGHH